MTAEGLSIPTAARRNGANGGSRRGFARLGILCDYGVTLWPDTGIGVFVYNLVAGLQRVAPDLRITLQCHPGDQDRVRQLARERGWDVDVAPAEARGWGGAAQRIAGRPDRWRQRVARAYGAWETCQTAVELQRIRWPIWFRAAARGWLKQAWRAWQGEGAARRLWATLLLVVTIAALPVAWTAAALYYLLSEFAAPLVLRPWGWAVEAARRGMESQAAPLSTPPLAADCDLWLIPHAGAPLRIPRPSIVGVWDLVHHHVPHVFTPSEAAITDRRFEDRVREASIVFCGARHVLEQDLKRVYPYARDRLRLLPLAPPADFPGGLRASGNAVLQKFEIDSDYLLYPASFAAHKNHARLVRAFALVRRLRRHARLKLVLTGAPVPPSLQQLIAERGVQDGVRLVGRVARADLHELYLRAALVPLPSLHEGYGLPLLEALAHDVPVVCADIPAFRELLAGHDESTLFFDPRHERFVADAIVRGLDERSAWLERQRAVRRAWSQRTWDDVARDFLVLGDEACAAQRPESSRPLAA